MLTFQEIADAVAAGTDTEQHMIDFREQEIMLKRLTGANVAIRACLGAPGWSEVPHAWRIKAREWYLNRSH